MSEPVRPDDLVYDPLIQEQVRIFNAVLGTAGVAPLFWNKDITIDLDWTASYFLKFNLRRPERNSVELDFRFLNDGMTIDFQGLPESFEFSKSHIQNKSSEVEEFFTSLMTCPILVEYKGGAQYVNLFNRDGSRFGISSLQSLTTVITGGYWKSQSIDQHLFEAIYPVNR